MFKMSYSYLYNSRVCNRSIISSIFCKINEISTAAVMGSNQLSSNLKVQSSDLTQDNQKSNNVAVKSKIVAAAFASLNENKVQIVGEISTPHIDVKIANATTVDQLLSICNGEGVSRRIAFKIVSILSDWTDKKKVKLADFENDFRFIKLCKVLTKRTLKQERLPSKSDDLSTVLRVTADDEAAKLVESISLTQMIKVMITLSIKKRRSTLLLRSLAYNITASPEKLNLKHCADVLYSMCTLNFFDENLLSRVVLDICSELQNDPKFKKSSVIGSIITSLGLLRYKDPMVLDSLASWITKNSQTCRSQDVFSLFITLATLNYIPDKAEECFNAVSPLLTEREAEKPVIWLDHIWSKVLLNIATPEEISTVLSNNFLSSLSNDSSELNLSTKLKLLNIQGAMKCMTRNYNANLLTDFALGNVVVPRRKEKIDMSESITNSLKNLMKTEKYLKTNIDTGYGFLIDAECVLDRKCIPKELNVDKSEGMRIAILSLDYQDMTRGRIEPTGINEFAKRLLEATGYKVLTVPFSEFKTKDKLVARVQYLEKCLKELVENNI